MFYQKENTKDLRFGDVLKGYFLSHSNIKGPNFENDFSINVEAPKHCVVLSPCCSIGNKNISLSPLIQVLRTFFNNPYFIEDLTRINRVMKPEQSVSPTQWEKFPQEVKQQRLEEKETYAHSELFIYQENEIFSPYVLKKKGEEEVATRHYMIDFRNIQKINCDLILTNKNFPFESKCLELAKATRGELREKISYYFGRTPEEDLEEDD